MVSTASPSALQLAAQALVKPSRSAMRAAVCGPPRAIWEKRKIALALTFRWPSRISATNPISNSLNEPSTSKLSAPCQFGLREEEKKRPESQRGLASR